MYHAGHPLLFEKEKVCFSLRSLRLSRSLRSPLPPLLPLLTAFLLLATGCASPSKANNTLREDQQRLPPDPLRRPARRPLALRPHQNKKELVRQPPLPLLLPPPREKTPPPQRNHRPRHLQRRAHRPRIHRTESHQDHSPSPRLHD